MDKKIFKKILALLTIIMIIATDFFVLGSNLISYAATLDDSTNNENIEFSVYFKNDSGTRVDSFSKSIKNENLKMYAEIKVKNEGYFNGNIELQDSNFKIKSNILSSDIASIEGNKVELKQINAGNTVEIELDIEPIISETIAADMLSMDSTVTLTGTYMETTYKGLDIEATKTIKANFEVDESAEAELITDIITNTILSVGGDNKRIVQLLIKSRLLENQYPINQTLLEVTIPQLSEKLPEKVEALALGTEATNGKADYIIENYKNEDGKLQITLENVPDGENNITWNKDVYDEIVVTLIYSEDVDASVVEIATNSEIKLYNSLNTYTATHTKGVENKSLNNTITTQIEAVSTDIYKGQLYENVKSGETKDVEYKTKTILQVTTQELADKVKIHEGPDEFATVKNTTLVANTKFISTEINKEKMLEILGQDGMIQINDGETINSISKDTEANERGNIVIKYTTAVNELEIITSKPLNAGVLEIQHTKAITGDSYTYEQVKTINQLTLKNTVSGTLGENNVVENSTETGLELKETETKAELIVNKENLSTMTSNNEVILGVKLVTDGVKYDLYKNPTIKIQLPSSVENITVNNINPLYADGFNVTAGYDKVNKIIDIKLTGEQLVYPEQANQIYLQINLNITLEKLAPSATDKITMVYTNENATQYAGGTTDAGIVEKAIGIVSPSGLIPVNNIETYNIEGIGGISEDKQVANIDKNTDGGKNVKFDITLVNNTKSDANNVRILGILPTDGEFVYGTETITNTFATTLKSAISAPNATVYYSNNMKATEDLNDANNGWTQNLAEVANPKAYLIVIPNIPAEGRFDATYTVILPTTLDYDLLSYAGYQVLYNEGTDTISQKVQSTLAGITTGTGIKLETNISATVGNDTLNNGDTVKAGEVIRYIVTAKNNGTQTLENVVLKSGVPEGTVYVEPDLGDVVNMTDEEIDRDDTNLNWGYVYSGASYYLEKTDIKEVSKTITNLMSGQEYTFSYEVRVNMDAINGAQISNKSIATYQTYVIESNEVKATVTESKIRVTTKCITDERIPTVPGSMIKFAIFIENFSNESVKNLEMQILAEGISIDKVQEVQDETLEVPTLEGNKIAISEIPANGVVYYKLTATVNEQNNEKVSISVNVIDSNSNKIRSNVVEKDVSKSGAKITLTTPNNGEYIKIGDEVIYNIDVESTGDYTQGLKITDEIPEDLIVQTIYENGVIKLQSTDVSAVETYLNSIGNNITYYVTLQPEEKTTVTIVARVKNTDEQFEMKTITNVAKIENSSKIYDISEEVTHIIQGNADGDTRNIISGIAWLDENQNGKKDSGEKLLSDIKVRLFDISTNSIAKNRDGNTAETTTNSKGEYTFTKIDNGKYIVLFEFDRTKYELTEYMKEGVQESQNSNVVLKSITIDGQEQIYAVTDTIDLTESISNINIGLKENLVFDLELDKYISRIVVQNQKGTKTYEYNDSTYQKVEINGKQLNNSIVILEYTIRVKNAGEIAGNVNSIVDYLPSGLEFSSELNPDWYLSGENLYTKSLANDKLQPGETRDIKLILTKKMTENNTGLINNRAEIEESFNEYGKIDIDSIPNNLAKDEDDLGSADVTISISTGAKTIAYTLLIIINIGLIAFAIYLIFEKNKRKI